MGRLASGIPQIPPKCNHNSRPLPASDPVVMALRGPQAVVLLKCGPEPRSRLLYVSQLLLNDAAERGQKIKIACTLCNGMSPKEMSTIVALDRNEKVNLFKWDILREFLVHWSAELMMRCSPFSACLDHSVWKSRKSSKLPHFENYDAVTSIWLFFWRKIKMSRSMIFIDCYMHVVAKWEFSMDFQTLCACHILGPGNFSQLHF